MKTTIFTVLLASLIATPSLANNLTILVQNAGPAGEIRAAIFDTQKGFATRTSVKERKKNPTNGKVAITFKGLKPGTYGIAVFQDKNGNKKLDSNLFGIPNEPYGFSKNPKIGLKAPTFEKFSFSFDGQPKKLIITLNGS
ncbi:MAG: DUF2141 domain-containing protein [Rhizobiaceae bacterium]|nr:DUF2141 domain-containing protein [Rhizobiaceae bacterium]MBL4732415.1 DUF2141 domain-containing protein [Rhizobiaceae bacterium]